MSKYYALRDFSRASAGMSFQIEETFYHIDVHEQEIVGNIKQFVLYGLGRQEAAINSPEVECGLRRKKKKVNRMALTTDNQQDIQGKEQKHNEDPGVMGAISVNSEVDYE